MRIGIVTATYPPSRNGVATSTALFVRGLRALGHEVRVFAPRHPAQYRQPGWVEEGEVYRLPTSFRAARLLGAPADYPVLLHPRSLTRRLPLDDLDVLHTMHPFLAGRLALDWSRRPGRVTGRRAPVVYTAHTQYDQYLHYSPVPPRLAAPAMRRHVVEFAAQVDAVLAPGQAMQEMLRRYGYAGEVQLFPNPVDLSAFTAADGGPLDGAAFRVQYGLNPQAPLAMYLGRLAPEKNLEALLAAFALARQSRPELQLAVVGDGPSYAELSRRLPPGAVLTGGLPYEQVPLALAAADVFVTASTSEVLPMSMIEALAARAPLVAARSPAALDLIQEGVNGHVTGPQAEALAQGLLAALDPRALPGLRRGAWDTARTYDLSRRAQALAELYSGLLDRC
ncbi:glycosyl transferase group 1 [Deinococcus proteolyticus MRP]|uniref:Glycosyl transferase group 1 n=1 Tax=Deinococcus proteolyticus (strain ATCC 35074 / DSM 20540 / JCM 6276 / NBRC 101906 / NCIMB 13154 / VKM Ac-1939 / CCM 2703 / MRP) TaxID=693977 RepID=F0RIV8_DEIPM|nr:glycosyltransferase [Deinococcus proteolyticus]ADY25217.1 glycosyl transferase group 1 [Deinococcus proteolyticus MRP]